MKIIAPVRGWQMGREEEIAYAREHGIPVKGGTEAPPYSIDDNLWGRSSEGGPIEDLDEPPRDDVFELVTRPEEAPDEPQDVTVGVRARRAGGARRRAARAGGAARARPARSAPATASGSSTTSRTASSASRCATSTRCRRRRSSCTAHKELEKLVGTIHQNNFKPHLDEHWAYLVYAGLWYEPLLADLNAYMDAVNEQVTGEITMRLYKGSARAGGAPLAQRALRPGRWPASASRAACSRSRRARASSSSGRCSRGWRTTSATGERRSNDHKGYTVLGWLVWQMLTRVAKLKIAQNKVKLGAAATVFAVLVAGVLAAKASSSDD